MMNFTKKAGAVAATTLLLATSANAAIFNASASFRTIADISITEASALSFGTALTGKAGTLCNLTSIITAAANNTTVDVIGAASGSGCSSTDGVNGGYNLSGANSSTITLLLATVTDASGDFSFAPAGQYNDLNAGVGADLSTAYFPDSPLNVTLSATGTGLLSVGGDLTIINELTSSTSYSVAYDISVIY
jgi:hypothetical protein